jgi:hypothetical protein
MYTHPSRHSFYICSKCLSTVAENWTIGPEILFMVHAWYKALQITETTRPPPFFATNFPSWLEDLSNFDPELFNLPTNAAEKNYIILLLQRYNEAQMLATNNKVEYSPA